MRRNHASFAIQNQDQLPGISDEDDETRVEWLTGMIDADNTKCIRFKVLVFHNNVQRNCYFNAQLTLDSTGKFVHKFVTFIILEEKDGV